jgi:hypothetical protein
MPDSNAQKSQIKDILRARYFPMILQLPINWPAEQHEKNRLSRSLAAFAIEKMADLTTTQASDCVLDGGDDSGIDAIHFDRQNNILWLIQSKANHAPDQGETLKFCNGVRYLVAARFDRFSQGFARLQPDVEEALQTRGLHIEGCVVHQGDRLGLHAAADLESLKTELNIFGERFRWQDLNLSVVYGWLTAEHTVSPIDVTLTLESWFGIDQPRRAFYGTVTADQLASLYETHGKAIFEKNIRHYLGGQEVNLAIEATVEDHPEELFFLNNGLTAVCSFIEPTPGATNQIGVFHLDGFSVVNGAQTVGSIATVKNTTGALSANAKVMITLIEVGSGADNVGQEITRARNTQNAIRGLYFAALDPQQERLRQELAISGITYYYRPSAEATMGGQNVITIEQAAIALACFSGLVKTVVAAKKGSGQIYERTGPFYPTLFNESLSGIRLCRSVRIFEYLNGIFAASEIAETDFFRRMFYRHGRFFILCILARRRPDLFAKAEYNLSEADKADLSRVTIEIAETIYTVAEARFQRAKGYLSVFRNNTDAEPLARDVMQRLEQPTSQMASAPANSPPPAGLSTVQPSSEVQP